jgi:hypothetical protein
LAFAALVASMVMVKHDQIEGLLGDLPFATSERGTKKPIDHLDQRGGPNNGVKFVDHQRVEGVKRVAKEPFRARQPEVSFSVMVALFFRPRLVAEVLMVPGQHEEISGLVWHHRTKCSINRFGVFTRGEHVIEMRANGLERCAHGDAVERLDHVEKG